MPNVTIEHVILAPLLILQIFLFPITANLLVNTWVDSRRSIALQEVASIIGSTIHQIYTSLNHEAISAGTLTQQLIIPQLIENYPYVVTATLHEVSESASNSSKILDLHLKLKDVTSSVNATVLLNENVYWQDSSFISTFSKAYLKAEKFTNGTIILSFGG